MEKTKNNKQKREDDSKQVEKSSCQEFLELYNKQFSKNIKFIKVGNPDLGKGEPDCICSDGLNIEIAAACVAFAWLWHTASSTNHIHKTIDVIVVNVYIIIR